MREPCGFQCFKEQVYLPTLRCFPQDSPSATHTPPTPFHFTRIPWSTAHSENFTTPLRYWQHSAGASPRPVWWLHLRGMQGSSRNIAFFTIRSWGQGYSWSLPSWPSTVFPTRHHLYSPAAINPHTDIPNTCLSFLSLFLSFLKGFSTFFCYFWFFFSFSLFSSLFLRDFRLSLNIFNSLSLFHTFFSLFFPLFLRGFSLFFYYL